MANQSAKHILFQKKKWPKSMPIFTEIKTADKSSPLVSFLIGL